jgi:hypothetical protein
LEIDKADFHIPTATTTTTRMIIFSSKPSRLRDTCSEGKVTANPKYLVEAVESAIKKLKKRAEKLPDDDSILIRARIGDLAMTINSIKAKESDVKGSTCFHLWSLFAVSLDQIHMDLTDRKV